MNIIERSLLRIPDCLKNWANLDICSQNGDIIFDSHLLLLSHSKILIYLKNIFILFAFFAGVKYFDLLPVWELFDKKKRAFYDHKLSMFYT